MFEPKPLVCENCGGPIERRTMRCPYCGTQYTSWDGAMKIEVHEVGVHTLRCQVQVARVYTHNDPERAAQYALGRMREQIADGLLAYMKMSTTDDPRQNCQIIRGEVRVIIPEFWD